MKKRILSALLCLVMCLLMMPTVAMAGGTGSTELRLTGSITSVTAGELPAIDVDVTGGIQAYVEHGSNTNWAQKGPSDANWHVINSNPIAVNDGVTRYAMVLCVTTTGADAITTDTAVYYNGQPVSAKISTAGWGAYVTIDLGLAKGSDVTTHTVTFNSMGGSSVNKQTIVDGKTASRPTNPGKEGYTFGGWYTNESCTSAFDFNTAITSDITLYAKWTAKTVLTALHITGSITKVTPGTLPAIDAEVQSGENASVEHTSNTHWRKKGASDASWKAVDSSSAVKDGSTHYGMCLCINAANGYAITSGTSIYYNGKLVDAIIDSANWGAYVIIDLGLADDTVSVSAIDITNVTVPVEGATPATGFTVATTGVVKAGEGYWYNVTDGAWQNSKAFEAGKTYQFFAPVAVADGYAFMNPFSNTKATMNGKTAEANIASGSGSYRIRATFGCQPATKYTVSFNMNGHGSSIKSQTVTSGSKAAKPADPAASGYTFGGWYKDQSCKNAWDFNTVITADTTIYAKWTKVATVISSIDITNVTEPVAGAIPGKSFTVSTTGVAKAADGYWYNQSDKAWQKDKPFEGGKTYQFYAVIAVEDGYSFMAPFSNTKATMNGKTAQANIAGGSQEYRIMAGFTCPEAAKYTVNFNTNGYGSYVASQTVTKGNKAVKPADPTASGYTFGGWYKEASCVNAWDFNTAITDNVTIYAKWTKDAPEPKTGEWKKNSKGWWYSYSDGTYPAGGLFEIEDIWYGFDANGYMLKGWQKIDGKWYYFETSGAMKYGWFKDGTVWYYLDPVTGIMQTGWANVDGADYYFNAKGEMLKSWQQIDGKWYYFAASGAKQKTQWIGDYYLDYKGVMVTSAYIKNGEKYYWVNKDGKYTKTYTEKDTPGYTIYDQYTGKIISN